MIRILWISAFVYSDDDESRSGVWQKALFAQLSKCKDITLANVGPTPSEKSEKSTYSGCQQWSVPRKKCKNGRPPDEVVSIYNQIIEDFKPDVVHVWGSENFLKLLPFDDKFEYKKLMVMQGVLSSMSKFMFSGLSFKEILSTYGLREIVRGGSLFWEESSFRQEGELEEQMLQKSDHVMVQSNWTSAQVKSLNRSISQTFVTRQLRTVFLESDQWSNPNNNDPIILGSAIGYSFKGLHILIKAIAEVKKVYPGVKLRLASAKPRTGLKGMGYFKFIFKLIEKNNLHQNIEWIGRQSAQGLVDQLQQANAFVQPSFVESYSVALAEAMAVGTPCVVSYAGAMPELAHPGEEALFFQAGDFVICADNILRIIGNQQFANQLSDKARRRAASRVENTDLIKLHENLYRQLIKN